MLLTVRKERKSKKSFKSKLKVFDKVFNLVNGKTVLKI